MVRPLDTQHTNTHTPSEVERANTTTVMELDFARLCGGRPAELAQLQQALAQATARDKVQTAVYDDHVKEEQPYLFK